MKELTRFYKLLSDETRLRILLLLRKQKLCVCQLCGILEESQPKVSKQLAKLRDLDIISDERSEQYVFYYLSTDNSLYLKTLDNISENLDNYKILKKDCERAKIQNVTLNKRGFYGIYSSYLNGLTINY